MRRTPTPSPLPGLATDAELAVGRAVVKCRECKHPLTGQARLRGLGDACAHKLGHRSVRGPGLFEVEQEGLFDAEAALSSPASTSRSPSR